MTLLGLLGFLVASLAWTFVGWRCWTGRWRFWLGSRVTFLEAWWPLGLPLGAVMSSISLASLLIYLGEEVLAPGSMLQPALIVAGPLLIVPIFVGLPLIVVAGRLMFIEDTYRRKPNGTPTTRTFLPRWYREELRQRVAMTPDLRSRGARVPGPVLPPREPEDPPPPPGSPPPPPPPGPPRG